MDPTINDTMEDLDVPIALRRKRRSNIAPTPSKPHDFISSSTARISKTPSRLQSKKRVRFSEPGPGAESTGLTPAIHRTSFNTPSRRHSAPLGSPYPYPPTGTIQFTPLRQVIDDRLKRRIKRDGLSEEQNNVEEEWRSRIRLEKELQAKEDTLGKLRKEFEALRSQSQQSEQWKDDSRPSEIEEELSRLKESMTRGQSPSTATAPGGMDWEDIPRPSRHSASDGDVDDGATILIGEGSFPSQATIDPRSHSEKATADTGTSANLSDPAADAELLAMALDLESARREKRVLFRDVNHNPSFSAVPDMDFADTPSRRNNSSFSTTSLPSPPADFMHNLSKTLAASKARAEDAELALHTFTVELKTLGFPGAEPDAIMSEIEAQFKTARLELERTIPGETVPGFENAMLLQELVKKIKSLLSRVHDRESELRSMYEQQHTLRGNFEHSLVSGDKAREKIKDLETVLDQSAEEMLRLRMKVQGMEKEDAEKERTINSLIGALDRYRADVARLEQLVTTLESERSTQDEAARQAMQAHMDEAVADLECKVAAEEKGRRAAEQEAVARLQRIKDLQTILEDAERTSMDLQLQMQALTSEKDEENSRLTDQNSKITELHSQQLGALNSRISQLSTALDSANGEVKKLTIIKSRLESRREAELEQAQADLEGLEASAVKAMESALVRGVTKMHESSRSLLRQAKIRKANSEIEDEREDAAFGSDAGGSSAPMTPVSLVRFVDVEVGRGVEGKREGRSKQRSANRDSGIALSDLSEDQFERDDEGEIPLPSEGMDMDA